MKDNTHGNKVVIQMYHNHPPISTISEVGQKQIAWMRVVWDTGCEEAANIAGSDQGVAEAYQRMVMKFMDFEFDGYKLPFGPEAGAAVFHILGSDVQMTQLAVIWRAEIERWAESGYVSGDDTYFDYFPDFVEGLRQLCEQTGLPHVYNEARQFITKDGAPYANGTIGDNENVIPAELT